jgi:hypothetical protein
MLTPALFAGCYTYVPVDVGMVSPGMEIRARIAAQAAAKLADTLGLSDTRLLPGTLVSQHDGGITLSVQIAPPGTTGALNGIFQQVSVSKPDLLELEMARLDKTRTALAVGIVAGGIIVATALLHGQGSGGGPASEQPPNVTRGILHFHF